ncbi:MAG: DMT family transporter [Abditibacteriales bacterium]|nr:DMT family transporter [Abditibacteriales bacterium]MDW8366897.1 DMT family transporter [Abditibacteriales bacterium]
MPLIAIALVLMSCVLHAFWNLLLKRARDKLAFTALFLLVTPLIYLPMCVALIRSATMPPRGWLCVLGTAVVYFGYFVGLARAYVDGELSIAYPLARGVGPALTLVWGVCFLQERPTAWGMVGVGLILGGATALHYRRGTKWSWRALTSPSSLAALFVGLMYSLYSLIDKVGVSHLKIHPAIYIYLTYSVAALMVAPWVLWRQGAEALRQEWQRNRASCLAVGALNLLAYLLVLFALSLPHTPISYLVPLRTASVLLGVVFGVELLGEEGRWTKIGAAALMMTGIALITWRG